jgi:hypothetical protein
MESPTGKSDTLEQLLESVGHHPRAKRIAPAPRKYEISVAPRFPGGAAFSILDILVLSE